jgi:very-long-chain ceramide synthase
MFRYLALSKLCDATFVWFLLSWLVTRHGLFLVVIKSVYTDLPKYTNLEWAPERGRYISYEIWLGYVGMLVALQVFNSLTLR